MTLAPFVRKNLGILLSILFVGILYFSIEARTFLIRGLMRTGLYKAEIKSDRKKMLESNTWSLPRGISFTDSQGQEVKLADRKGKVLFINFWATWCPPCRAEMPSINALHQKLKDNKNIEFFIVDVDKDTEKTLSFMKKKGYDLPIHTPSSFLPPEIFDGNLPTTVVISPEGKVIYHHIGVADYDNPDFLSLINGFSK
jgi:thiol-disulfide isomerase/thioredoxin